MCVWVWCISLKKLKMKDRTVFFITRLSVLCFVSLALILWTEFAAVSLETRWRQLWRKNSISPWRFRHDAPFRRRWVRVWAAPARWRRRCPRWRRLPKRRVPCTVRCPSWISSVPRETLWRLSANRSHSRAFPSNQRLVCSHRVVDSRVNWSCRLHTLRNHSHAACMLAIFNNELIAVIMSMLSAVWDPRQHI